MKELSSNTLHPKTLLLRSCFQSSFDYLLTDLTAVVEYSCLTFDSLRGSTLQRVVSAELSKKRVSETVLILQTLAVRQWLSKDNDFSS